MSSTECFISGEPYTFATKGERPWKERLSAGLPVPSMGGAERGVWLNFSLSSEHRNGEPFDLDNLAEPVFSVLINRMGWFHGQRPNMHWWIASKGIAIPSGCRIAIESTDLPKLPVATPLIDATYGGPLPKNARTLELARWAEEQCAGKNVHSDVGQRWALYLGFTYERLNLGDIATGPIKSFIDCLFPWFGGQPGAPDDHKVATLIVERVVQARSNDKVHVRLWPASCVEFGIP